MNDAFCYRRGKAVYRERYEYKKTCRNAAVKIRDTANTVFETTFRM